MNGEPIPRNKDGLIERICIDCGKVRYSKKGIPRPRCTSCGKKHRFKSQSAVGLKNIDDIDHIILDYQSGISLKALGEKCGCSAMTIRSKLLDNGCVMRDSHEIAVQKKTFQKAHAKVRELCETGEFQKNMSARLQGIPIEEWKGFITPENKRLVASPEYRQWQKSVFKRDNRTCQFCGKTNYPIAAHHIYMKAKYPHKVLDIDNGITLCNFCHHKTIGHEDEYIDICISIPKGDLCGKRQ